MAKEERKIVKRAAEVVLSAGERIAIAVRSGLQLIPFGVGSAIETWYFGTIDARRLKRIDEWISVLKTDLGLLEDECRSVPETFFESDEFAYFLEGTIRRVSFEVAEEKLAALRGVLVSVVVGNPSLEFDKKSSFLKTVDVMEGVHLSVLQLLASRRLEEGQEFVGYPEICGVLGATKESDINFVYSALDTLANREFVLSGPIPLEQDGRLVKAKQAFRCTELGAEFLAFIRLPA